MLVTEGSASCPLFSYESQGLLWEMLGISCWHTILWATNKWWPTWCLKWLAFCPWSMLWTPTCRSWLCTVLWMPEWKVQLSGSRPSFLLHSCQCNAAGHQEISGIHAWSGKIHWTPNTREGSPSLFQNQPTEAKLETVVLNVAYSETKEDGSLKNERSLSIQVALTKTNDEDSNATRKKLINFAKLLYHVYVFPLGILLIKADLRINGRPWQACIFGFLLFAWDARWYWNRKRHQWYSSAWIWVKCISQELISFILDGRRMMRRGISTKPGILQDIPQKHLSTYQAPLAVSDLLTRYCIAASQECTRLKDIQAVNWKIEEGWKIDRMRYGLVFIIFDSLGFRILGARAGYDQYTMILVFFITPEQLMELGFYRPCGSLQPPISRKRLVWNDITSTVKK